jgi:hypothetical protein
MLSTEEITVLFEEPFWIALIEYYDINIYSVAKVVIGSSEPQGAQLLDFFGSLDDKKLQFTVPMSIEKRDTRTFSFKKQMHKNKHTQTSNSKHEYTKAHSLLKEQQCQQKMKIKKESRIEKEKAGLEKFKLKQQKKKSKHRGH